MKRTTLFIVSFLLAAAGYTQTLKTHKDSISYALGVSMAESLKKSGVTDIDPKIFTEAVNAQLNNKANMSPQDADKLYADEKKKMTEAKSKANQKAGEDFLAANKSKPGVQTTASGLQYKHTVEGTGSSPSATDKVTVHYHGTLIDGTPFDSSVERGQPATFGLNQVIAGWTEGLQLMKEGGKTTFYIPFNLAYGARGQGKIGPYSTLVFEVELISIDRPTPPACQPTQPTQPGTPPAPTPKKKNF